MFLEIFYFGLVNTIYCSCQVIELSRLGLARRYCMLISYYSYDNKIQVISPTIGD